MKKSFLIIMALMAACIVNAQDIITLANGESFYAKNIRFSGDKVYFNRWNDNVTSSAVSVLATKDLSKIVYESGEEEFFRKEDPNAKVTYNQQVNNGNVDNSDKSANVNVSAPNTTNNGGYQPQQYNGVVSLSDEGRFMDNARFNAYAEGVGALFMLNDGHGGFGGFNSPFFGISGSAGARINDYFYVGAGVGFYYGNGNIENYYDSYYGHTFYRDASSWFLPVFFDIRGFVPVTDEFSLFGEVSVGLEFNQYSSKKEYYTGKKCGKTHLNLCVGAEIQHFEVSMGVMAFSGIDRYEEYYDNYSTGEHSHSVYYGYGKVYPVLYLKVGYRFGE